MKPPRRHLFALLILAVLITLLYLAFRPRKMEVETAVVERGTFIETLQGDGVFRSRHRQIITAFATGDIKRMPLEVGDTVKKGAPITELFWDVRYEPVRSPMDGVVSKVFRESAGPIARGEPIIEVIDPSALDVVVEHLTSDAVRIDVGDPALVTDWGGTPGLQARVARVSRAGFVEPSSLGVEEEKTEITLELADVARDIRRRLGHDFHVEVSIEIERNENSLILPSGSVFQTGSTWAVYLARDGRAVETPIVPGASSQGRTRILSGLSEGDVVVNYPGDLVRDGTPISVLPCSRSESAQCR